MAKILIIRLTSLGDVIFTLPLVNALKKENEIGYLVAEKGLEVIKDNPSVSKVHFAPINEWKKRPLTFKTIGEFWTLIKELRAEQYDIALDCQQMFKSMLLFMLCGAKRRITFTDARELSILAGNEFIKPKAKFRDNNYHIVERHLDFARHLGIETNKIEFTLPDISEISRNKIQELIKYLDKKPIAVIAPATTWSNKHWNEKNWARLIDGICESYNLIFTGTVNDEQLIERILHKTTNKLSYINLVGKTNLDELKALFSLAKLVISTDSGSAHLAWASSKPAVITIFTCTPQKRFGPYGQEKYFSIGSKLSCHPCFKKKCTLKKDENLCCNYPAPDEIIKIVNQLRQN